MKTFKNVILFLSSSLLLSGCMSSFNELRTQKPDMEFTSTKPPQTTADCILFGWQQHTSGFFHYGESYIQNFPNGGFTVFSEGRFEVVDLIPKNKQIKLNFYHQGGVIPNRLNKRVDTIKSCI